jgi:dolichol-phosphate mannosyltransferase
MTGALAHRVAGPLWLADPDVAPATGDTPEISVVVPTLNERDNIVEVIDSVAKALEGVAWEIIVVDDDSPDGTAARVKQIARDDPRVRCLRRTNRRGLAGACIEGMLSSSAPYLAVMDADLQHDTSILPNMLELLRAGRADLVIGSRYAMGGSIGEGLSEMRARISRWAITVARRLLHIDVQDLMSGYFAIRRDQFDLIAGRLAPSGFKILVDIIASAGGRLRTVELGYMFKQRKAGQSKLGTRVALDFIALLIDKTTQGRIPIRFIFFSLSGASGIVVHLAALRVAIVALPSIGFTAAQALATLVAMTSNFFVNNLITYHDMKLKGAAAMFRGLVAFWALCTFGAIANVGVAAWIFDIAPIWWLAGLGGTAISAVWNYSVSSLFVWSRSS